MNNIWKILKIEPTNDKNIIRHAYAKQSKSYHLEENPEAFKELNQAYQEALKYAARTEKKEEKITENSAEASKELYEIKTTEKIKTTEATNTTKIINVTKITNEPEITNTSEITNETEITNTSETANTSETENEAENTELKGDTTSLLFHLKQTEEQNIQKSMQSGALKKLIMIFEDIKNTGKQPKADIWKEFFISEEFLKEQYSDEFGEGLLRYLLNWNINDNYNINNLPFNFIVELSIAYALIPEEKNNLTPDNTVYEINASGSFHTRELIASILNKQENPKISQNSLKNTLEDNLKSNLKNNLADNKKNKQSLSTLEKLFRALYKPENLVRLRSFSDYMYLKNMNYNNLLNKSNRENWHDIILGGCTNYIYEMNNHVGMGIYPKTRSIYLLILYTNWIKTENVPECILEDIYKEYTLKDTEHTSSGKYYAVLKQEILKKYPNIESELYGEESKAYRIKNWCKDFINVISNHHNDYDKGIYEESEKTKECVKALFERPEWKEFQSSSELFDTIFLHLNNRKVVPFSLAEKLIDFYYNEENYYNDNRVFSLIESLIQSIGFNRRMKEIDGILPVFYEKTSAEDISDDNFEFWQYYLMIGFGFRQAYMKNGRQSVQYAYGNRYYLPAYIKSIYYPSLKWRKLFTKKIIKDNDVIAPNVEFTLPDKKRLKVEFYLHYCLYFLDNKPIYKTEYMFGELEKFAKNIEKTEHFFFLLAITEIKSNEKEKAQKLIEEWLKRLPLYPITIPVIAELLSNDNAEEKEAIVNAQEVHYIEQENICLKLVVEKENIALYHKKEFGWDMQYIDDFIDNMSKEGCTKTKEQAKLLLKQLNYPKPVSLGITSLEGMDNIKKAEEILEAMKRHEKYLRGNDISDLIESYCILRYGAEKKNERVFYYKMFPFCFDLNHNNPDLKSTYQYRTNELCKKIKERYKIAGHFGWGEVYTPKEVFEPKAFAIGESGTYYYYDVIRMVKKNNLTELLAKMFDFTNVTEVEIYQGCLSISRLDDRLEYCYGKDNLKESISTINPTSADFFTYFTKAEIINEFNNWLSEIISEDLLGIYGICFFIKMERANIYSLNVYNEEICEDVNNENIDKYTNENNKNLVNIIEDKKDIDDEENIDDEEEDIDEYAEEDNNNFSGVCINQRLFVKDRKFIWRINKTIINVLNEFEELLRLYILTGNCKDKLKTCRSISIGIIDSNKIVTKRKIYENRI